MCHNVKHLLACLRVEHSNLPVDVAADQAFCLGLLSRGGGGSRLRRGRYAAAWGQGHGLDIGDALHESLAIAQDNNAELPEIALREPHERVTIDLVLLKAALVLAQAQAAQPVTDILDGKRALVCAPLHGLGRLTFHLGHLLRLLLLPLQPRLLLLGKLLCQRLIHLQAVWEAGRRTITTRKYS